MHYHPLIHINRRRRQRKIGMELIRGWCWNVNLYASKRK